eukprot:6566658-Prymnesium_polylepis.2
MLRAAGCGCDGGHRRVGMHDRTRSGQVKRRVCGAVVGRMRVLGDVVGRIKRTFGRTPRMADLDVASMAAAWRRDLLNNVVPFWETHSLDREHGGYFTCLDRDGSLLDDVKCMWLQGRAVYMWARLHNELSSEMPEAAARWFEHAKLGADFLRHGKDAEGRLLFAVSRDGTRPLHFQRKPYSAVFYVLACLEYAMALQQRGAAADADEWLVEATLYYDKLRDWIITPHLLGRPPVPADDGGHSVLADVMCLASLSLDLLRCIPTQRERWLADIRDAQRRVAVHYHAERAVLMERAQ